MSRSQKEKCGNRKYTSRGPVCCRALTFLRPSPAINGFLPTCCKCKCVWKMNVQNYTVDSLMWESVKSGRKYWLRIALSGSRLFHNSGAFLPKFQKRKAKKKVRHFPVVFPRPRGRFLAFPSQSQLVVMLSQKKKTSNFDDIPHQTAHRVQTTK